jgi:hypothetical protein
MALNQPIVPFQCQTLDTQGKSALATLIVCQTIVTFHHILVLGTQKMVLAHLQQIATLDFFAI